MTLFSLVVRGFEACFLAVRFLVGSHGGGEMGVVFTLAWAVRLMGLKCFVSQ